MEHRSSTRVALIGAGIGDSLSPALHEREARELGLNYVYRLINCADAEQALSQLPVLIDDAERSGYRGLNITYPCKQAVIPLLNDLSDDARALGAVNTVVFDRGRRIGHNTDLYGFAESYRMGLRDAAREHVVLLGAGGAGCAVAHAMMTLGTRRLAIFDVDLSRAEKLVANLEARFGPGRVEVANDVGPALASAQGLINATPTGMAHSPGLPLDASLLRPDLWVADIVYFPLETALLSEARALRCRTLNGGGMAVFQAAGAFKLFSGVTPDAQRMLRHFADLTRANDCAEFTPAAS